MKRKTLLFTAIILLLISLIGQSCSQSENTYRLMTYNIHHAEGMDKVVDCERIGELVIALNPEVVAFQEVDSVVKRSGNIDIMKLLSEQTGMHASFGYSILHDGGKYGNGVLTREKPLSVRKLSLPGKDEARTALVVELNNYYVVNTHLSLDEAEREASVDIINAAVKDSKKPVFLLGDLNAHPGSETINSLKKYWQVLNNTDHFTFPSEEPNETIDYILSYKSANTSYEVLQSVVVNEPIASDHRPLYVDVRVK